MTVTAVLAVYTTLVATLALALSLLILSSLRLRTPPRPERPVSLPASGPDLASPAPPILARTNTAALLDSTAFAGQSYLVAFLLSSCQGCRTALPTMIDYAGRLPGPQRLIAVIVGDPHRGADIEERLASVATIVFEPAGGPITAAYRITVFPSYVLISDTGTVLATGQSVLDLPQPQPQ